MMRLNELRSQLRSLLAGDWSGTLLNPNFVQKHRSVTWNGYESMMVPEDLSFKDVANLAGRHQYSFQLSVDGSLFQFYYAYEENEETIAEARVAYYEAKGDGILDELLAYSEGGQDTGEGEEAEEPHPEVASQSAGQQDQVAAQAAQVESAEESDAIAAESPRRGGPLPVIAAGEIENQASMKEERRPRWFRIDYRAKATQCVLHNDCHIHFAGFPGSRLVVAGIPTPKQFVEFVFSCCYPKLYEKVRLDEVGQYADLGKIQNVNEVRVPLSANRVFSQMTHLRIPGA